MDEGMRPPRLGLLRRPRVALPLAAAMVAAGAGVAIAASSEGDGPGRAGDPVLTPSAVSTARRPPAADTSGPARRRHPQVVHLETPGAVPKADPTAPDLGPSPGAQSDAQVKAELKQAHAELASFKRHLASAAFLPTGPRARVLRDGMAVAPDDAPDVVKRVIQAGNEIARFPYKWGGGHGAWRDSGYDCSGSVSFALAGAGLLRRPLTSGGLARFGDAGRGHWITIYANGGHVFMFVAGLRFDTSGRGRAGTRWQEGTRSVAGFAERHPPGL